MSPNVPLAQPGDCFILLEPHASEVAAVRQQQRALQERYGGRPHQRIHLTCQRFAPPADDGCVPLIERLRLTMSGLSPFPVVGVGLELRESPFWCTRLLRWQVEPSDPVCQFIELLERVLWAVGYVPHFASADWKDSAHVTMLDDVAPCGLDGIALPAPQHLFMATYVVLSRLTSARGFAILERLQLLNP